MKNREPSPPGSCAVFYKRLYIASSSILCITFTSTSTTNTTATYCHYHLQVIYIYTLLDDSYTIPSSPPLSPKSYLQFHHHPPIPSYFYHHHQHHHHHLHYQHLNSHRHLRWLSPPTFTNTPRPFPSNSSSRQPPSPCPLSGGWWFPTAAFVAGYKLGGDGVGEGVRRKGWVGIRAGRVRESDMPGKRRVRKGWREEKGWNMKGKG